MTPIGKLLAGMYNPSTFWNGKGQGMPDTPTSPGKFPEPPLNEARLESWGEIAAYLRRDIRTVQRWERLHGLPVRRLRIGKQGQVYAFRSELDDWVRKRQPSAEEDIDDDNGKEPPPAPGPSPEPPPAKERPNTWWKITILGLLLLASFGWATFHAALHDKIFPGQKRHMLFVRPFASLPVDAEQQLFVTGLKDEMITQLGDVDATHLGVFAPTTSSAEGSRSIEELRTRLNADYVLEGSVRRAADKLRIDVVLISTKDSSQVWAKSYTGDAQNILKLQDNVTQDVSGQIRGTLPGFSKK